MQTVMKRLRKTYQVSQGEIANALGLSSPQYVSNVERGLSKFNPEHFPVLAAFLTSNFKKRNEIVKSLIEERLNMEKQEVLNRVEVSARVAQIQIK